MTSGIRRRNDMAKGSMQAQARDTIRSAQRTTKWLTRLCLQAGFRLEPTPLRSSSVDNRGTVVSVPFWRQVALEAFSGTGHAGDSQALLIVDLGSQRALLVLWALARWARERVVICCVCEAENEARAHADADDSSIAE